MGPRDITAPKWQRALPILTGVVVVIGAVTALQWGRPVFIPIAIAALLTLLLSPIVQRLDRFGLHHVASVLITVSITSIVLAIGGSIITFQVTRMLADLPKSTDTIKTKIRSLRQFGSGPTAKQFSWMIDEISDELSAASKQQEKSVLIGQRQEQSASRPSEDQGAAESTSTPWLWITGYLGSAAEVMGAAAFCGVLIVFFLLEGREWRDRLVVLAGKARISVTSRALDDISDRVTRYLGMVALVNGGFGLALSTALYLLGMPYAMLWGFVAAAFRFIPYLGPWIGALFPIVMSLAVSDGWWQPFAVLGAVIVLELATNNLVEPFLFGHTTGVSPTALLICAAFWLYLWGPLGLVLSIPFAVCLVVIGKNVPELRFLSLLLSDEPALTTDASYYQRLMLGESEQALGVVAKHLEQPNSKNVYDELLIPTVNRAKSDMRQDRLEWEEYKSIIESMHRSLPQIDELAPDKGNDISPDRIVPSDAATVVGIPASDSADELGLEILRRHTGASDWNFKILSVQRSSNELITSLKDTPPDVICIASIPPGGLGRARRLCKTLRDAFPEVPIVIGRWGQQRQSRNEHEQFMLAGATAVAKTQAETCVLVNANLATANSPA